MFGGFSALTAYLADFFRGLFEQFISYTFVCPLLRITEKWSTVGCGTKPMSEEIILALRLNEVMKIKDLWSS